MTGGKIPPSLRRLAVCTVLAGMSASATGQVWVTALSEQGRVSVNGTFIEKLKSSFKTEKEDFLFFSSKYTVKNRQRWWNLTVVGPDRYAIRQDGRVSLNGEQLEKLAFGDLSKHRWMGLAVANGCLWSLRSDGRVSLDGSKAMDFAAGDNEFRRIQSDGTDVYHLRTDGAVFRNDEPGAFYRLKGGGDDGGSIEKNWRSLAIDDVGAQLYALRADGKVVSAALDGSSPFGGVLEAALPFENDLTEAKVWVDLAPRPDGGWFAIRGRGAVHGSDAPETTLVTFPGTPENQSNLRYMRVVATGNDSFAALQRSGYLYTYSPGDGTAEVRLRKGRYRALAVSDEPPDLSTVPNRRPEVMRVSVTAIEGVPLEIPVRAVDVDLPIGAPSITVDPADLPAGATYDASKGAIVWPSPLKTAAKSGVTITVSDGASKTVRVHYKLRVRAVDLSPANRPPDVARMRNVAALARQPFRLPIVAVDADGDTLQMSVDPKTLPEGASFDAQTSSLLWTPTDAQIGRHRVVIRVSDGTVERRRTVLIRVKPSLLPW